MSRPRLLSCAALAGTWLAAAPVAADEATVAAPVVDAPAAAGASAADSGPAELRYLVPDLAEDPFRLDDGRRPYRNRISFSPAYGSLGSERLYAIRLAWNPNAWLGWEASVGHNPGQSVHAVLHTLDAVVRHPFPGRLQPYLCAGYGMMLVYPGESFNADPVTANVLAAGGGLEIYVRNDLAIRAETRAISALSGDEREDGTVAYRYGEFTIGLSFYRGLGE
jgi:hypothetical protein